MRLSQFTLAARDIELLRYWYMRYFAMSSSDLTLLDDGTKSYSLRCPDGDATLLILHDSQCNPVARLSVSVASRQGVDFVTELLRTDGNPIVIEPAVDSYGIYRSAALDPEGNRVDVTC